MPHSTSSLIVALLLMLSGLYGPSCKAMSDAAVGFQERQIDDVEQAQLRVGIWYPAEGVVSDAPLEAFHQRVALNGRVTGGKLPLIVISHGGGGSFASHYDTALALARAGFVVAAVSHRGDTYDDQSRVLELWRRSRQLSRLVDYMLDQWPDHSRLDPRRVGAFGFSNGGFTVLVAVGGIPDLKMIGWYCEAEPEHDLCRALHAAGVDPSTVGNAVPADAWAADRRIRAAVIAAPAFGFTFTRAGLKYVHVPIQLWRAENDRHQPSPFYEERVRKLLPTPPDYHVVSGAGHFDFLPPCPLSLAARLGDICTDPNSFDRTLFHRDFNRQIVRFFRSHLPTSG